MYDSVDLFVSMLVIVALVAGVVYLIIRVPFKYPYFEKRFDVSGKRKPKITEYIDEYLIKNQMTEIEAHEQVIQAWKESCEMAINKSLLKKWRRKQYESVVDDKRAYHFTFYCHQTRYRQANYMKTSYQVTNDVGSYVCSYDYLADRNRQLAEINYEIGLDKYHSKEQRKLMTPALRKQIMERDNYTCQICGKYMPDEVGLHIDHIIPVAKGGKSVPSNLQVLCSKCNGSKKDKIA